MEITVHRRQQAKVLSQL